MKDFKLKRSTSGLGAAYYIICVSKTDDWTNPTNIRNGLPIERNAAEILTLYQQFVDYHGNISIGQGEFDTRKGLTKAPITTSGQHSITITHSYINVTTWFLNLLYQINAKYLVWNASKIYLGCHIRRGKDRVFEIINISTGLVLDVVCSGGDKGGTSTDGGVNSLGVFSSEELVESLKVCFHGSCSIVAKPL